MSVTQDPALERLKDGIRRFQAEVYPAAEESYRVAATTPQKPHTLVISCADSRVNIETITNSHAGQIFAARNVGNMVPSYGEMLGGVSAVIEYAVAALKVQHIVVCGHMDCGAMKGLKEDDSHLDSMPTVKSWLRNATAAKAVAAFLGGGQEISLRTLTEQNVLLQMTHLQTHPSVRGAMARQQLTLSGWIYDIESGDVLIHNGVTDKFESVREEAKGTTAA